MKDYFSILKNIYIILLHALLLALILGAVYWNMLIPNFGMGILFLILLCVNFLFIPWFWGFLLKMPDTRSLLFSRCNIKTEAMHLQGRIQQFIWIFIWFCLPQFLLTWVIYFLVIHLFFPQAFAQPILNSMILKVGLIICFISLITGVFFRIIAKRRKPETQINVVIAFLKILVIHFGCWFAFIMATQVLLLSFTPYTNNISVQFVLLNALIIAIGFCLYPFQNHNLILSWRLSIGILTILFILNILSYALEHPFPSLNKDSGKNRTPPSKNEQKAEELNSSLELCV